LGAWRGRANAATAEAVGLAAARVRSPWVMVVFPGRRCAEVPRDRGIAAVSDRGEAERIRQGRAPRAGLIRDRRAR